ncbi:zinc transporter 4 isoform X2 [Oncorhynchus masou masou]|uniref:zinc transporter 4 isoform X2 n=1 Tax=Oncorhynchus masou masou TaxID=90313 RepID=UPI0031831B94
MMSGGASFISKVRSAFRKEPEDWDLSDTAPFDLSGDELAEDEAPKFNKLKVVVSGEMEDYAAGAPSNGVAVNTVVVDDDDSLLDSSSGSLGSPGVNMDRSQCESCTKKREGVKRRRVMKKLACASVLYFLFMIGELIVVSLLALWLSAKPPTNRFTFGLHRLEVVSAGISVLLIYILTGVLLNEAVQRTVSQDFEINGDAMLITAAVGVAVNLVMGFLLNQTGNGHLHSHGGHGHSHGVPPPPSHGHSHGGPPAQGPQGSLVVRAAFIHALGDLVQSIGVLIAAYIVRFKPEYKLADPICTYIFSILVLFTTIRIIRDTGVIVLEGAPRHVDVQRIREDLLKLEDVQSVDELNVWALTGDKTTALAHLRLSPSSASAWEDVQAKARHLLIHTYGLTRCTVQVQTHRNRATRTCTHCRESTA